MAYPKLVKVKLAGEQWISGDACVECIGTEDDFQVIVSSEQEEISFIQLIWTNSFSDDTEYMGDAFEQGYGDLGFVKADSDFQCFWYFMACEHERNTGYGVKIQPNSICRWSITKHEIILTLDIRSGSQPLQLRGHKLVAAEVLKRVYEQTDCFYCTQDFCRLMCPEQNQFDEPVIGGNDWYYAYGNNSKELILKKTDFMEEIGKDLPVRPWMVIDDGWQVNRGSFYNGGPWNKGNDKFGDMSELAETIREKGVRPGIWLRPLLTNQPELKQYALKEGDFEAYVLDISRPEVLKIVTGYFSEIARWGFEMIKHDFSTYDILGCWGNKMQEDILCGEVKFHDNTKTTAEIFKNFYKAIKEAVPEVILMGCNTISHLSAGCFEIMRTGDDTSGKDFSVTLKNGVNSLAFRMPQHHIFYSADADCVGITREIDWEKNKKWLSLLAHSKTPLFISCNPDDLNSRMKEDIKEAFRVAASLSESAVPMDWKDRKCPQTWRTDKGIKEYIWYENR